MLNGECRRRRERQHRHQRSRPPPAGRRRRGRCGRGAAAHASTARPLSANMPRGRFWMNRMMKTSSTILPSTAPISRLEDLVGDAEHQRAERRAPEIADAAEHHDHEAVDDVALAEVGRDVVDLATARRRRCPRPPSRAPKASMSTRAVEMPIAAAMRRFWVTARICRPKRRRAQHQLQRRRRRRSPAR